MTAKMMSDMSHLIDPEVNERIVQLNREMEQYVHKHYRQLPWRQPLLQSNGYLDEYGVLISEIMLQQTQVSRVVPKFTAWMKRFPTARSLANASLHEVLQYWSGLGYNRRGKYAHEAAKQLVDREPWTASDLEACKGIGYNTAAAIIVYSYNQPLVFVETNVRSVFMYYFEDMLPLTAKGKVHDKDLEPYIRAALDEKDPRMWYWSLMDYGSYLKKEVGNSTSKSAHYTKQSKFEGSFRQLRSRLLREIMSAGGLSEEELLHLSKDDRLQKALKALQQDGLVTRSAEDFYEIAS